MAKSGSVHRSPETSFLIATTVASRGLALKMSSKNTVALATADTDVVIGLSLCEVETGGTTVAVATSGFAIAKLGGTVTIGQKLTVDSSSRLVAINADTDLVCAIAMEGGAINEFIEVLIVPGAIGSQASTGILVATRTLTTAEILTLNTTPIALVAAPGAGIGVVVERIIATMDYAGTAYATNVTMEFRYTNGSGTKVTADIAALLDATADKIVTVQGIEAALVVTANAAVVAVAATGNPATGTSDVKVTVVYRLVTI